MAEDNQGSGVENIATTATAVGELIRAAGDSTEAKQAGAELGKALVTVTKALNNVLLPLAALNSGFDRARAYFDKKFGEDLAEVTKNIPPEALIEPRLSIAGPVIQALAFALEDPPLKSMFLELLSKAMTEGLHTSAHPAFVEVIRQLTSEEAVELKAILRQNSFAIVNIRENKTDGGAIALYQHLLDWRGPDHRPAENPNLPMMVVNWVRLGLVEVSYTTWLVDDRHYAWVAQRPEFLTRKLGRAPEMVDFQKGMLSITPFGHQFAQATGIRPLPMIRKAESAPPPPPATH